MDDNHRAARKRQLRRERNSRYYQRVKAKKCKQSVENFDINGELSTEAEFRESSWHDHGQVINLSLNIIY